MTDRKGVVFTKLNWEPFGRKVKAALLEAGMDEDAFVELAEEEMSKLNGLEDPYDIMMHSFELGEGGPWFMVSPGEEERTLRIDLVKYVDMTDVLFPDGIPEDHPFRTMSPDGAPKSIMFPEPDYDEDEALH